MIHPNKDSPLHQIEYLLCRVKQAMQVQLNIWSVCNKVSGIREMCGSERRCFNVAVCSRSLQVRVKPELAPLAHFGSLLTNARRDVISYV